MNGQNVVEQVAVNCDEDPHIPGSASWMVATKQPPNRLQGQVELGLVEDQLFVDNKPVSFICLEEITGKWNEKRLTMRDVINELTSREDLLLLPAQVLDALKNHPELIPVSFFTENVTPAILFPGTTYEMSPEMDTDGPVIVRHLIRQSEGFNKGYIWRSWFLGFGPEIGSRDIEETYLAVVRL